MRSACMEKFHAWWLLQYFTVIALQLWTSFEERYANMFSRLQRCKRSRRGDTSPQRDLLRWGMRYTVENRGIVLALQNTTRNGTSSLAG